MGIDALFAIEREINGLLPEKRRKVCQERSRPRVEALGAWLREQDARFSPNSQVAKAIAFSLNAWDARHHPADRFGPLRPARSSMKALMAGDRLATRWLRARN